MSTTLAILRAARSAYAEAPSHAPYGRFPETGCHCPITAIARAGSPLEWQAEIDAKIALATAAGIDAGVNRNKAIMQWNEGASTAEVEAAFDKAIADWEA